MKRLRQAGWQRHLAQKSYSPPCLVPSSLFAPLFFSKIFDVCVDGKLVRVGGVKEVDHDLTSNDLILNINLLLLLLITLSMVTYLLAYLKVLVVKINSGEYK